VLRSHPDPRLRAWSGTRHPGVSPPAPTGPCAVRAQPSSPTPTLPPPRALVVPERHGVREVRRRRPLRRDHAECPRRNLRHPLRESIGAAFAAGRRSENVAGPAPEVPPFAPPLQHRLPAPLTLSPPASSRPRARAGPPEEDARLHEPLHRRVPDPVGADGLLPPRPRLPRVGPRHQPRPLRPRPHHRPRLLGLPLVLLLPRPLLLLPRVGDHLPRPHRVGDAELRAQPVRRPLAAQAPALHRLLLRDGPLHPALHPPRLRLPVLQRARQPLLGRRRLRLLPGRPPRPDHPLGRLLRLLLRPLLALLARLLRLQQPLGQHRRQGPRARGLRLPLPQVHPRHPRRRLPLGLPLRGPRRPPRRRRTSLVRLHAHVHALL
jgi:hypothetical protein